MAAPPCNNHPLHRSFLGSNPFHFPGCAYAKEPMATAMGTPYVHTVCGLGFVGPRVPTHPADNPVAFSITGRLATVVGHPLAVHRIQMWNVAR